MNAVVSGLVTSLSLTLGLELLFSLLWGLRTVRSFLAVCLANILTNPPVVALYLLCRRTGMIPLPLAVLLLEAGAVWAEGLLFRRYSVTAHPFGFSLYLNGCSYLTGLALQAFWFAAR